MNESPQGNFNRQFNKFIETWGPENYAHLTDSDENDGQKIRDLFDFEITKAISETLDRAIDKVKMMTATIHTPIGGSSNVEWLQKSRVLTSIQQSRANLEKLKIRI